LKVDDKYKMALGCEYDPETMKEDILVDGEPISETIEVLLEIKKYSDGLAVDVSRTIGNKVDFYHLFSEMNSILNK